MRLQLHQREQLDVQCTSVTIDPKLNKLKTNFKNYIASENE